MDASHYRQCPKCGSKNYDRSQTQDVTYHHRRGQPTARRVYKVDMPWWFECMDCGYKENSYGEVLD